jgi:hypothetical protein
MQEGRAVFGTAAAVSKFVSIFGGVVTSRTPKQLPASSIDSMQANEVFAGRAVIVISGCGMNTSCEVVLLHSETVMA